MSTLYLFVCLFILAPGDPSGMLNTFRPPGPMGPRGVQGPHLRPDMAPHFQGPGGPRQGPPIGPLFPGPEGPMMGVRMRGLMPPRMQGGHGVGRGPRPLLPEMVSCDSDRGTTLTTNKITLYNERKTTTTDFIIGFCSNDPNIAS